MTTGAASGKAIIWMFVGLVVLAGGSWLASSYNLGNAGSAVALAIAGVKALGIALVFMELYWAHAVDRVIAVIAVFFVILLCVGSLADVAFR